MHCQLSTIEHIFQRKIDDTYRPSTQYCRPATVLTNDLLWHYTGFPDYTTTTEKSDTSSDPALDQSRAIHSSYVN